ncbi:MAG: prepilin peptidase, partial [Minisyncoccota bacterium]
MITFSHIILFVLLFAMGAIIGSFINVVGLRYRSGLGIQGRSFCPSCSKELKWFELVPILSFLVLRRRCGGCKAKISWQYPLVEAWVGVVFVSLYMVFGLSIAYALALTVFCFYSVILIYDIRHKIIPDALVYTS